MLEALEEARRDEFDTRNMLHTTEKELEAARAASGVKHLPQQCRVSASRQLGQAASGFSKTLFLDGASNANQQVQMSPSCKLMVVQRHREPSQGHEKAGKVHLISETVDGILRRDELTAPLLPIDSDQPGTFAAQFGKSAVLNDASLFVGAPGSPVHGAAVPVKASGAVQLGGVPGQDEIVLEPEGGAQKHARFGNNQLLAIPPASRQCSRTDSTIYIQCRISLSMHTHGSQSAATGDQVASGGGAEGLLLVGSPGLTVEGVKAVGGVSVYRQQSNGPPSFVRTLKPPNLVTRTLFGANVAVISKDRVAISTFENVDGHKMAGSVYIIDQVTSENPVVIAGVGCPPASALLCCPAALCSALCCLCCLCYLLPLWSLWSLFLCSCF